MGFTELKCSTSISYKVHYGGRIILVPVGHIMCKCAEKVKKIHIHKIN